jgi:hypothetical protein
MAATDADPVLDEIDVPYRAKSGLSHFIVVAGISGSNP